MSLFIVAREVWMPAAPAKPGKAGGPVKSSAHAEASLGRGDGCWIVLWKTPAMSSVAFSYYDALTDAWPRYAEHRATVRRLNNPPNMTNAAGPCGRSAPSSTATRGPLMGADMLVDVLCERCWAKEEIYGGPAEEYHALYLPMHLPLNYLRRQGWQAIPGLRLLCPKCAKEALMNPTAPSSQALALEQRAAPLEALSNQILDLQLRLE